MDMTWQMRPYGQNEMAQSPLFDGSGVVQGFSTRAWGNMALHTGDNADTVICNRENFLHCLGLDLAHLVAANQVHSVKVCEVERKNCGAGAYTANSAIAETDALMTQVPGVVLSIFTADCLPIFLYDPKTPAIALIHAGWRGTIDRIAEMTVAQMVKKYHTVPGDLQAAIGPAICAKCFQVHSDVAERFASVEPAVVHEANAKYYVDLAGYNVRIFTECGILPQQISLSGMCTCCHPEQFFSYRSSQQTIGRMMGIICLKDE